MATNDAPNDLKARLKRSYDVIAPTYNAWTVTHSPLRMIYLEKLLKLIPTDGAEVSVLELGCGAGSPVTEHLLGFPNFSITANDLSSTQIGLAKARLGEDRVSWREGDMMALDVPDASFEAVLGFYSLIHLPRNEQEVMLTRIAKWLKPGGYLLANFSEEAMEGVVMEKWLHPEGWMYWSGWGPQTLEKVKQAGLEVVVEQVEEDEVDVRFLCEQFGHAPRSPDAQSCPMSPVAAKDVVRLPKPGQADADSEFRRGTCEEGLMQVSFHRQSLGFIPTEVVAIALLLMEVGWADGEP